MPASVSGTGIHWQVAQATSLMNIVFQMSTASGNAHQGRWCDRSSIILVDPLEKVYGWKTEGEDRFLSLIQTGT